MKKKKTYAMGSKIRVESPQEALMKLDRQKAEARAEVEQQFGWLNMASGVYGMFADMQSQKSQQNDTQEFGAGGKVGGEVVNIEGGETLRDNSGNLTDVKGASHEMGGIDMFLQNGVEVFSKRLKKEGETMAKREKDRTKAEKRIKGTDALSKKTLERTKAANEIQRQEDMEVQEKMNTLSNMLGVFESGKKTMAGGGQINFDGLEEEEVYEPYTNPLDLEYQLKSSLSTIPSISSEQQNWESTMGSDTEIKSLTPSSVDYQDNTLRAKIQDKDENQTNTNAFKDANFNDYLGVMGTMYPALSNYMSTIKNRAGDTENINPYENYGEDSLATMDEAQRLSAQQGAFDQQEIERQRLSASGQARAGTTSINTLRGLDTFLYSQAQKAGTQSTLSFSQQMADLLGKEAQTQMQVDNIQGQGKLMKDMADRADKDNYDTQLAASKVQMGEAMQQTSRALNQMKYRENSMDLIEDISQLSEEQINLAVTLGKFSKEQAAAELAKRKGKLTTDNE